MSGPTFEEIALSRRFVTPEQIEEAKKIDQKIRETGIVVPLEEILLQKGWISPIQLAAIHAAMGKGRTDLIPGYEILSKIGQGGMGAVYRARQTMMDRVVAIKTLLPHFAREKDAVERFLREARVLARLSHPNIVAGLDAGYHNGIYYFVMEFIEGTSLKQMLQKQPLDWDEAIDYVRQIASALEHAARFGIVHRDIKPENILITRDGVAKLTDLGLAKLVTGPTDVTLTRAGYVMGTPAYLSPEQAQGHRDIDVRSDIYSLGLSLYEALSGKPAYSGDNAMAVVQRRLTQDPPWEKLAAMGVPAPVIGIGRMMTFRDRQHRYPSPRELIEDCEATLQGRPPPHAQRHSVQPHLSRRAAVPLALRPRSRTLPVVLAAVSAAVVFGLIAWLLRSNAQTTKPPSRPVADRPPTLSPNPRPAIDPELEESLAAARQFEADNPQKIERVLRNYEKLRPRIEGTRFVREIDAKIEELRARLDRALEEEMAALAPQLDEQIRGEHFGDAEWMLLQAEERFEDKRWKKFLSDYREEVRRQHDRVHDWAQWNVPKMIHEHRFEDAQREIDRMKSWKIGASGFSADQFVKRLNEERLKFLQTAKDREDADQKEFALVWTDVAILLRQRHYAEARQKIADLEGRLLSDKFRGQAREHLADIDLVAEFFEAVRRSVRSDTTRAFVELFKHVRTERTLEEVRRACILFAIFDGAYDVAAEELRASGEPPLRPEYSAMLDQSRREFEERRQRDQRAQVMFEDAAVRWKTDPAGAAELYRKLLEQFADTAVMRNAENTKLARERADQFGQKEAVIYAADVRTLKGKWRRRSDPRAPSRNVLYTPEGSGNAEKFDPRSRDYVELELNPLPNTPYRMWIHMAFQDPDSNGVYVQFEDAVDQEGRPFYPFGSGEALIVQYFPPGVQEGYGWTDRDMRRRTDRNLTGEGPVFQFKTPGRKKVRIYLFEDGTMIDQVVISSEQFIRQPPQDALVAKPK